MILSLDLLPSSTCTQYSHLQDPTEQLRGSQARAHIQTYTVNAQRCVRSEQSEEMQSAMPHILNGWKVKHANIAIPLYITAMYRYTLMTHSLCIMAT